MRISDWSSDVCSSDLLVETAAGTHDVAIVERTLDCRAGDTGVPQFLRADDRLARYEGFQLFTLAQRRGGHVTNPMTISTFIRGFVTIFSRLCQKQIRLIVEELHF